MQGGQRPRGGENRTWMGQHIGLVGEQGKSRRVMGDKMGRTGSPGLRRALNARLRTKAVNGSQ